MVSLTSFIVYSHSMFDSLVVTVKVQVLVRYVVWTAFQGAFLSILV
jgi:hypothetical protein